MSCAGTSSDVISRHPVASRAKLAAGVICKIVQRSHGPLVATYTPRATRSPSFTTVSRKTNSDPARGVGGSSCAAIRSGNAGTSVAVGRGVAVGTADGVGTDVATGTGVGARVMAVGVAVRDCAAHATPRASTTNPNAAARLAIVGLIPAQLRAHDKAFSVIPDRRQPHAGARDQ